MSINSLDAEKRRQELRQNARHYSAFYTPNMPRWQADGTHAVIYSLQELLESALKREEQYVRIIRKTAKPPKIKKCQACEKRRIRAEANRPFGKNCKHRLANYEEIKKILASISECWPDFRRVPELLWNQYIDSAPICRCGRVIAPKRASRGAKVQDCSNEHTSRRRLKAWREEKKRFAIERKSLEREME